MPKRIKFNPTYCSLAPTKPLWDKNGKLDMEIFNPINRRETWARILA